MLWLSMVYVVEPDVGHLLAVPLKSCFIEVRGECGIRATPPDAACGTLRPDVKKRQREWASQADHAADYDYLRDEVAYRLVDKLRVRSETCQPM